MKLLALLSLFLLTLTSVSFAQTKSTIKGRLIDSTDKKPIELATVALLDKRDSLSNLISYTVTDKTGAFVLHNIPTGIDVKILISHAAYRSYRNNINLLKGQTLDLGEILLQSKQLTEVVIKGERMPVSIKKDTIIFDAEAFKVRPNAVVEDLLKKLPGIEVDNDGSITVTGKKVSKVLVDGKEFFSSDLRIATKNLDADLISKVLVYDNRENDPDHIIPEAQVDKIIDLKFKKPIKKSIFGKVYAGEGTQSHYQAGGLVNMFRDTLQISLLGAVNDLNNTGFSFSDLYSSGGLNRGGEAISRSGIGFGFGTTGTQKYTTGGININTDYGKKLKINVAYLYKRTSTDYNTITNKQQFFNDTTATTHTTADRLSVNNSHSVSATVEWHPNTNIRIRYTPQVNINTSGGNNNTMGNSFSNFVNPINLSDAFGNAAGNNFQFSQSLSFNKQLKKKQSSFTIEHSLQVSPAHNSGVDITSLQSFVSTLSSFSLNRQSVSYSDGTNFYLSGNYRYPLTKKLIADVTASVNNNHQINNNTVYDFDPTTGKYSLFVDLLSSDLKRNTFSEVVNPGLTYNFTGDVSIIAHLNSNFQNVTNIFGRGANDLEKEYYFLLPSASFNYKSFSVGYDRGVTLPNIGDLVPYAVVYSPIYSVTGNPDLSPTYRNTFSLSYRKFNLKGFRYYINAGFTAEENSVVRKTTTSAALVQTSTPVNQDGRRYYNLNANVTRTFTKRNNFQLSTNTSAGISSGHNFFIANGQDGFQNTVNINASQRFSLNWKDIVQFDPEYSFRMTHVSYEKVTYPVYNYGIQNLNSHLLYFFTKHYNLEADYKYQYNPLVPDGFQKHSNLLSVNIAHQFLKKDRAEIKLSCYDVLNQSISISRSVSDNTITDTQSQIVRRYFLLSFQYKFNKSQVK